MAICAAVIIALVGYDVWAFVEPTPGDTISEVALSLGQRFAAIPFGVGVLGGHFFLPRKREPFGWTRRRSVLTLAVLGALAVVRDAVAAYCPHEIPTSAPYLFGIVAGAVLWGQVPKEDKR